MNKTSFKCVSPEPNHIVIIREERRKRRGSKNVHSRKLLYSGFSRLPGTPFVDSAACPICRLSPPSPHLDVVHNCINMNLSRVIHPARASSLEHEASDSVFVYWLFDSLASTRSDSQYSGMERIETRIAEITNEMFIWHQFI
ncbi:hypothetical protein CDAR_580091 [Caerostris darwini]|uniref:Uncharacterized protein n=1 Tax=Caerostris darwini TaxID=1538125 RepID=A0AAV4PS04_9ARAC|nr:hypothetical protein CDAR_580091 [Caerostris darwini]